jgi:O-antigen ligase
MELVRYLATLTKAFGSSIRQTAYNRTNLAEAALWIGLFAPAAINFETRTKASVLAGALDPVSISRGAVPIVCLVGAWLLRPAVMRPITRLDGLFLSYLAVAILSTAWSVDPSATLLKAINLLTAYLLIMFLARLHEGQRQTLIQLYPILVGILALSLAGFVLVPHLAFKSISVYDPTRRLVGVFPIVDPNSLGYIAIVVIVALLTLSPIRQQSKWLVRALIGAGAIAVLLLARSRTPFVLLVGALVFVADQLWRVKRRLIVISGAAIVFIAVVALLVAHGALVTFVTRGETANAFLSLTGRTMTWRAAINQWLHSPLIGFGYYSGHRVGIVYPPGAPDLDTVDNTWIESLVDVGLAGTLPLLTAVVYGTVLLFRQRVAASEYRAMTCRRALLLIALAASFFSPSVESPTYPMIIASICLLGAPRLGLTQERSTDKVSSWP